MSLRRTCFGLSVLLALGNCAQSNAVECGFGICPAGQLCDEAHHLCLTETEAAKCRGLPDGTECDAGSKAGVCRDQLCVALGCGDGILTGSEQCDGDQFAGGASDCFDVGYYGHGSIGCNADCTIDDSACLAQGLGYCGDGIMDPASEACDFAIAGSEATCAELGFYQGTTAPCTIHCEYQTAACSQRCGDNILNGPELCDGTAPLPSYLSCLDYAFDSGALSCSSGCYADTNACHHLDLFPVGALSSYDARDVWQATATSALVVGSDGTNGAVLHWDGKTITPIAIPAGPTFNAISGTSPTNVYLAGNNGRISKYDGTTLTDTITSAGDYYYGLHMRTASDGYAVGSGASGALVRHFDGTNWSSPMTITGAPANTLVEDVHAFSATDAWAVGTNATLLHGNGTSWTATLWTPGTLILRSVWGSASNDMFAVGDNGTILHYNGTWSAMTSPTTSRLVSIWGNAPDDVFALGNDVLLHYDGIHWVVLAAVETGQSMVAGTSVDQRHSLVLQLGGRLHQWEGAGWTMPATLSDFPTDFWATAPNNIFATTSNGVVHYNGRTWSSATTGLNLLALWGFPNGEIFAVGGPDIAHFNGSWSSQTFSAVSSFTAVWGAAPNDVYAGTDNGELFHYDGSWTQIMLLNNVVTDIWGTAANNMYVVEQAEVLHYDGMDWTTVIANDGTTEYRSMWGSSASNIYLTTDVGLRHYDGMTWTTIAFPNPNSELVRAVHGTGPSDVWVSGDRLLVHYDGTSWEPVRPQVPDLLTAIWAFAHEIVTLASSQNKVLTLHRACATCGL